MSDFNLEMSTSGQLENLTDSGFNQTFTMCDVCENDERAEGAEIRCLNCPKCCSNIGEISVQAKQSDMSFPDRTEFDENSGTPIVATRTFEVGHDLLQESTLMSGTSKINRMMAKDNSKPTCLGCFQEVTSGYRCRICRWPVCSKKCEKVHHHKKLECPILAEAEVLPGAVDFNYRTYLVLILRVFIMSDTCRLIGIWDSVKQLMSQMTDCDSDNKLQKLTEVAPDVVLSLLVNKCNELAELNRSQVHSIEDVDNGCSNDILIRFSSFLFYQGSRITHSCIPNTNWVIRCPGNDKSRGATVGLKLSVIREIKEGERITCSYLPDPLLPTFQRQSLLRNGWCFTCKCTRCEDPTENGTHLSTIICRCTHRPCPGGYIIPSPNPMGRTDTQCTHCSTKFSSLHVIRRLVPLENEFRDICRLPQNVTAEMLNDNIDSLRAFYDSYSPLLHQNHYLIVNLSFQILKMIGLFVHSTTLSGAGMWNDPLLVNSKVLSMIEAADRCLKVAYILCPTSSYTGTILFYKHYAECVALQHDLRCLLIHWVSDEPMMNEEEKVKCVDYIRKRIIEIHQTRAEAKKILSSSSTGASAMEKDMENLLEPDLASFIILNFSYPTEVNNSRVAAESILEYIFDIEYPDSDEPLVSGDSSESSDSDNDRLIIDEDYSCFSTGTESDSQLVRVAEDDLHRTK